MTAVAWAAATVPGPGPPGGYSGSCLRVTAAAASADPCPCGRPGPNSDSCTAAVATSAAGSRQRTPSCRLLGPGGQDRRQFGGRPLPRSFLCSGNRLTACGNVPCLRCFPPHSSVPLTVGQFATFCCQIIGVKTLTIFRRSSVLHDDDFDRFEGDRYSDRASSSPLECHRDL